MMPFAPWWFPRGCLELKKLLSFTTLSAVGHQSLQCAKAVKQIPCRKAGMWCYGCSSLLTLVPFSAGMMTLQNEAVYEVSHKL